MIAQANAMLQSLHNDGQPTPFLQRPPPLLPQAQTNISAAAVSSSITSLLSQQNHDTNSLNNFTDLINTLSNAAAANNLADIPKLNFDEEETTPKPGLLGDKPAEQPSPLPCFTPPTQDSSICQTSSNKQPLLPAPNMQQNALESDVKSAPKSGLLGDAPRPGLLGNGPAAAGQNHQDETVSTVNSTSHSSADSIVINPDKFDVKSPGSKALDAGDFLNGNDSDQFKNMANPLLALFIESRIRDQLAEFQKGTQPVEPPTPPSMKASAPSIATKGKTPLLPNPHASSHTFDKTPGKRPGIWEPQHTAPHTPQTAKAPLLGDAPRNLFPRPLRPRYNGTNTHQPPPPPPSSSQHQQQQTQAHWPQSQSNNSSSSSSSVASQSLSQPEPPTSKPPSSQPSSLPAAPNTPKKGLLGDMPPVSDLIYTLLYCCLSKSPASM